MPSSTVAKYVESVGLSTEGETKAIPEDDARLDFPEAFSDDRPGGDNYES